MIYDFIGIGIGPFNLSLASLTEPIEGINAAFLDQNTEFDWHTGMMLESAHLQTPFIADLVTMADPTSQYTVLNYMKQQGKIYRFYIREDFFLLRKEYNQYCQWVTSQLNNLHWHTRVEQLEWQEEKQCYAIYTTDTQTGISAVWLAKKLVLGTGPSAWLPECSRALQNNLVHSSNYLPNKAALQAKSRITVLGSGQSAAEIFYDLLTDIDKHHYQLSWITRSPRFYPLEYTKLTLEMTSPEWVDYFHALPADKRDELNKQHKNLYKGINSQLINAIFDLMYTKELSGRLPVKLLTHSVLTDLSILPGSQLQLTLHQQEQNVTYHHSTEGMVMATGYSYQPPLFISGIRHRLRWDHKARYDVQRNYSIDYEDRVFVQNTELHTHGFVTPDLGMACYRNSIILQAITGREIYPIEKQIAFQTFHSIAEE